MYTYIYIYTYIHICIHILIPVHTHAYIHLYQAAQTRCEADGYSLLGFVARKQPTPNTTSSLAYYQHALTLMPTHCEARAYLGELFLQIDDFAAAVKEFQRLQNISLSKDAPFACYWAFVSLEVRLHTYGYVCVCAYKIYLFIITCRWMVVCSCTSALVCAGEESLQ